MRKNIGLIFMMLMVALLVGCQKEIRHEEEILLPTIEQLDIEQIDRIQIVMAMGNPEYGTESKMILILQKSRDLFRL